MLGNCGAGDWRFQRDSNQSIGGRKGGWRVDARREAVTMHTWRFFDSGIRTNATRCDTANRYKLMKSRKIGPWSDPSPPPAPVALWSWNQWRAILHASRVSHSVARLAWRWRAALCLHWRFTSGKIFVITFDGSQEKRFLSTKTQSHAGAPLHGEWWFSSLFSDLEI